MPERRTYSPAAIEDLKARNPLAELVGRTVRLEKRGGERVGLCPFHAEKTPSFTVSERKGFYHCFGCGAHGDAVDWVMARHGVEFSEAVEILAGASGWTPPPIERQREIHAAAAARADAEAAERERVAGIARALWLQAAPVEGTPAETYLRRRGIAIPLPPSLRFDPAVWHPRGGRYVPDAAAGSARHPEAGRLPALLAGVQDHTGRVVAVHRIFVDDAGDPHPALPKGERKLILGAYGGAFCRLSRPVPGGQLWCEGIETGLAFVQAFWEREQEARTAGGRTGKANEAAVPGGCRLEVKAAIGATNMKNLAPPGAAPWFLGADGDAAGARAVRRAVDEIAGCEWSRLPRVIDMPEGKDALDLIEDARESAPAGGGKATGRDDASAMRRPRAPTADPAQAGLFHASSEES